jgi:uncharacterized protein
MTQTLVTVRPGQSEMHIPADRRRVGSDRRSRLLIGCEVVVGLELMLALVDTEVAVELVLIRGGLVAAFTLVTAILTARLGHGVGALQPAAAGVCALVLGSLGIGTGAGIGVAGLALVGAGPGSVFGVAAMIAGLVVTIAAAVWLLRPLRKPLRLLAIPAAVLVAQFWLLPVLMAVLGTHAPAQAFATRTPAGAERVSFAGADNATLVGWFTPSTNGATVIVLAGAGSTKADTMAQASVLVRHGYGVLAYDARGAGESSGHAMLWGWGGERDLSAAVTYLESRPDVDRNRIGVLGESMGGEVAITGTARDPRLRAVVAEGATGRVCEDLSYLPGDMEGSIHRFDSCLGWALAGLMTGAPAPEPLAASVRSLGTRPLLLIAADIDTERAATSAWRDESPATIRLWQPAETGHTGGLSAHPAEWESRVIEFLDAAL